VSGGSHLVHRYRVGMRPKKIPTSARPQYILIILSRRGGLMIVHRFGDAIGRIVPLVLCGLLVFCFAARAAAPTLDENDRASWAGMMLRVAAVEEFLTDVAGGSRTGAGDLCFSALAQEVRDLVRDGNNIGVLIGLAAKMAHPIDRFTLEDQVEKSLKVELANARASQQILTSLVAGDCATNAFVATEARRVIAFADDLLNAIHALRAKLESANTAVATQQGLR